MTKSKRKKLAEHLARYVFHTLGGPDRIAAKHKADGIRRPDAKGEAEGCGLALDPLATLLEGELARYSKAQVRKRVR